MKEFNKSISIFLILAIALTFSPVKSNAKFKDRSGELPGMGGGGNTLIIIGGAGLAVALVYAVIKHSKKSKTTSSVGENFINLQNSISESVLKISNQGIDSLRVITNKSTLFNTSNLSLVPKSSLLQRIESTSHNMPVDLIFAPVNNLNNLASGTTNGVQVGLRIRF